MLQAGMLAQNGVHVHGTCMSVILHTASNQRDPTAAIRFEAESL